MHVITAASLSAVNVRVFDITICVAPVCVFFFLRPPFDCCAKTKKQEEHLRFGGVESQIAHKRTQ